MGNIGTVRSFLVEQISKWTKNVYPGYADVFVKYPAVVVDVTESRIDETERYTAEVVVISTKREEVDDIATHIQRDLAGLRKRDILVLYTGMDSGYREIANVLYSVVTLRFTVYLLGGV